MDPVDPLLLFGARTNTGISNWAKDTCVCTSSSKCSCSAPPALTGSTRTLTCYRRHSICQSPRTSNAEIALAANFPAAVAAAMLRGETVKAVSKPAVSILFRYVDGYSKMRGAGMPTTVCSMLARLFGALDALAAAHGVERIDAVDGWSACRDLVFVPARPWASPKRIEMGPRRLAIVLGIQRTGRRCCAVAQAAALGRDARGKSRMRSA